MTGADRGQGSMLSMLPALWRIALRNAKRHKAQAIAAAAAVAVGTAVLAASLAAGQAAQAGITEVAFDVLGEHDELVRTQGDFFFPEEASAGFARAVQERTDALAVSPGVRHVATATTPGGLTEPNMLLVGFPPGEEGFGTFEPTAGSGELGPGSVLVNEELARALEVGPGDQVATRFSPPVDPVVPNVTTVDGAVTSASGPGGLPVPLPDAPVTNPTAETIPFEVEEATTRVVGVLVWGSPRNATDLDLELVAPDGQAWSNTNGTTGDPDVPGLVQAPGQAGTWEARVTAKAAADQPFRLVLIELRPAFSLDELREGRRAIEELGPLGEQLEQARGTRLVNLTVTGVVSGQGKGGFLGEPAIFLPIDRLQEMLGRTDEVNLIRVSNPGGPRDGLAGTATAMPVLEAALEEVKTGFTEPSVQALSVEPSKQQIVERAEEAGASFTRFLTTLSSFTIVAGILLVVNLFTMLAEERRVELSVARALGMEKGHLVGSFTLEGLLYSLPGAPVGALLGLGLAYGLIEAINAFVVSQDALPIPFIVEPWTPVLAAVIGLVFTVAAVAVTGWRLSGLDIAAGLKGQRGEPASRRAMWAGVLVLGGVLVTPLFFLTGVYTFALVGPAAVLYGGSLLALRGRDPSRARFAGALLVLAYSLWTVRAFEGIPPGEVPIIAPLRGTLMVLVGVVFVLNVPGLATVLKAGARRMGRWAPATMVAMAYPIKRQTRTGLTATMFALVLLVLAVFSSFFNVFTVDPDREAGGYDLYAETNLPIEDLDAWARANLDEAPTSLDQVETMDTMAVVRVVGGDLVEIDGAPPERQGPPVDWLYGIGPGFAANNEYRLVSRVQAFPSDRAAYQALIDDPSLAIVSRLYDIDEAGRLGRIQGGERLTLDLVGGSANFTILGAQEQQYLGGIFLERDTLVDLFPTHGTGILMTTAPGQDPQEVARTMEAEFQAIGLNVESIRAEATELQQLNARFFTVLQVFLGLGLVIGVASLGIVTAKSALEREQELGVLRALGVPRAQITWSLVAESLFTALVGLLPGILIGVAVSYASYLAFFADVGVPFTVPWASILWLSLITLVAALASTLPPARKAARTDVASAVRVQL